MTPSPLFQLRVLTGEAVRDAARRRIVAGMVVLSLLSLFVVDSCTSCASGPMIVNGREVETSGLLGFTSIILFGMVALWTVALAGVLAADHLTQTLDDGSARLVLARPVSRSVFALARLVGSLIVSLGTGAILLGMSAFFLKARHDFGLAPAAWSAGVATLGALTVASLAMAASFWMPRLLTFLLVFGVVASLAVTNWAALAGADLGTVWSAADRFGPPIGTGLALAASQWTGYDLDADPLRVGLQLLLWATFSPALLAVLFSRREV
jgi:ABC-type transport system involved in multi-copper enzyme maturation permease subunit